MRMLSSSTFLQINRWNAAAQRARTRTWRRCLLPNRPDTDARLLSRRTYTSHTRLIHFINSNPDERGRARYHISAVAVCQLEPIQQINHALSHPNFTCSICYCRPTQPVLQLSVQLIYRKSKGLQQIHNESKVYNEAKPSRHVGIYGFVVDSTTNPQQIESVEIVRRLAT
jgi:hypothetical protein